MMRLLANVALIISVFFMPWWVFGLMVMALVIFFPAIGEVVVYAFVFDLLRSGQGGVWLTPFVTTISALCLIFIVQAIKQHTRINR